MERQRHDTAVGQWEATVRQHQAEATEAERAAARRANGPLWFPVYPSAEPTRVDVLGGDPRRNGWASLLATLGSSELTCGRRVTLLDFTGQDVGGGLVRVAQAAGKRTRTIVLDGRAAPFSLFAGQPRHEIAECLAPALTGGRDGGRREERTLVTDILRTVIESLDGPLTFPRLAAAVRVLRQGAGDDELSDLEMSRLADHIGDIDQNEWTTRLLRLTASQLAQLHDVIPVAAGGQWLWSEDAVSVLATDGRRDDREELVQRLLVQLAQRAMADRGPLTGCLVVAGADRPGAATLGDLSDHARRAGVRLVLMIDQPQGDLEKTTGTGGAVCVMKMYNHRDANIAAEFIGKGYRFVLNQVTRQVGATFTDGGGDSFGANTGNSSSRKQRASGTPGRRQSLSDSRGHTWTGTRNWSSADNLSTSTSTSRSYEFTVEPSEILGMPDTAFILIDNSGSGRRVTMADGNPGICLLDRVSADPMG